ncbi:hypothetical protein ACFL11_00875 [Patescibacteria group bacterium]
MFEIDFSLLADEEGRIVGISLVAQPQTEAEIFCSSFPGALIDEKASIGIEGSDEMGKRVDFNHPTCAFAGTYSVDVTPEQAETIKTLLADDDNLALCRDGAMTPGFKIVLLKEKDKRQIRVKVG